MPPPPGRSRAGRRRPAPRRTRPSPTATGSPARHRFEPGERGVQADDVAVADRRVGVGHEVAEAQRAPRVGGLELPAHAGGGVGVGVLEEHRRLDPQDGEGHVGCVVAAADEAHLAALAEVHGDVGVERQPPVGEALGVGDGGPHVADRVGRWRSKRMTPPSAVRSTMPS